MKIPIAMPTYNRPDYLKQVLSALKQCISIEDFFIVTSEEPDQGSGVHEIFENIDWIEIKRNINKEKLRCVYNVPNSVNKALEYSDRVIVLEDDIVPSKDMLVYFKNLLHDFKDQKKVLSVTAYSKSTEKPSYDKIGHIEESNSFTCWGWATWKDRWKNFIKEFSPVTSSWAREFNLYRQKNRMVEIKSVISRCNNIGTRGVHVVNETWQRINQQTLYTSNDLPDIICNKFNLVKKENEEGAISLNGEVYSKGICIEDKIFEIPVIKHFCHGKGAKISASTNQVVDGEFDNLDNSIDFPYIGFQEKEYGPFLNKIDFVKYLNKPCNNLDFIFIENIMEHVIDPLQFINKLLDCINPEGIIFFEINNLYRKFDNKKIDNLNPDKNALLHKNRQINFWIPETFNKLLKNYQIIYSGSISARTKVKFDTVIQKC